LVAHQTCAQTNFAIGFRIGKEGEGLKIALSTLNVGRLSLPAVCTGSAKWCLKIAREWSKARVQWGHPIGDHEAIAGKIAFMAATTYALEAMLELSSVMADEKRTDIRIEAALAKLYGFVIIGTDLYLRGPTGGFQKLSTSSAFLVYDPTVILDPNRGVAAVLAGGTAATTEAREQVEGVDSYRVQATFPGQTLSAVAPGVTEDSTGQMWIATDGFRLVQARFTLTDNAVITVRFSDYDAPADITPPI